MKTPRIIAGRFRIEYEIGRGGMGTVYRATHLGLERPVAVKILKPEFAADPEVANRFMREARTMSKLRHARAAMIFDAGKLEDNRPFIVMEHVEGATLAEVLARENRFTPARVVAIAAEICDVLAEAHKLGIVHRDLKPSNIMLNERGVCVLDFGIAKVLTTSADATRTHATTESGLVIGTPRYMSPEQCMGRPVGPSSDIYSLGLLVYEMLAGHPPFTDPMQSAVLVKQAMTPPPPLVSKCGDVPRQLALATHTLLAKNPADRPKTAAAARALLEKSIAVPVRPAPPVAPLASTISFLNSGRSAFFRVAGVAAILAMLGTVLLVWAKSQMGAPGSAKNVEPAELSALSNDFASRRAAGILIHPLSLDEARRVAASVSYGRIGDVHVVRTERGMAIVAIHEQRQEGTTRLFVMERSSDEANYHVTKHAELDTDGFRGADWRAEVLNIGGEDGVLFTGTGARGDAYHSHRFVLYVPRERQVYSLHVAPVDTEAHTIRAIWSSNLLADSAQAYRSALRVRALSAGHPL